MPENTIIVEIKPFVKELQKAACDCHTENERVTFAVPLGQLIETALKYQIQTDEGWKEKKMSTISVLETILNELRGF